MKDFKFKVGDVVYLFDESNIVQAKIHARSLKITEGNWDSGGQVIPSSIPGLERYEHYRIEYVNGNTRSHRTILSQHLFSSKEEIQNYVLNKTKEGSEEWLMNDFD